MSDQTIYYKIGTLYLLFSIKQLCITELEKRLIGQQLGNLKKK